jgi:hypothetical protein
LAELLGAGTRDSWRALHGPSFAQAINDGGVLVLEYRDGAHFQARGVPIDEVAEALREWSVGEREFIGRQVWTRLDDNG